MKNMKTRNKALQGFALVLGLLLVGVSGAWADLRKSGNNNEYCSPVIHFKLPEGWSEAYLVISGAGMPFPKADASGWATIDLGTETPAGKGKDDDFFYINGVNKNDCNDNMCVTTNGVNLKSGQPHTDGFSCAYFAKNKSWKDGGEVWIQAHPDTRKTGELYVSYSKPNVKDFFIFLPNNTTWKSATPMIYEVGADGKTKDIEMYNDAENCGWYYRRYIDEDIPKEVVVHRDDDEKREEAIGLNGAWEEGESATPIPLNDFMEAFGLSC